MKLFESYDLNGIQLKNRVVMAPMTRSRATGSHVPTELMGIYYGQRAGAGLIITEGTGPSIHGTGYPRIPGVYTQEQADGWKMVTEAVHKEGGKIFLQLMHTGRVTHPENLDEGGKVLAPSAVKLNDTKMYVDGKGELEIPEPAAMTTIQIQEAIQEFVQAGKYAVEAGFDGVEIHAANGYLIEQFIAENTNQRDDEYGGSMENRMRFAVEVARELVSAIGGEKVGIRVSPYGVFNEVSHGDQQDELYEKLAGELKEIGLTYIHIVDHSAMGTPEVPREIKEKIRDAFGGTIIISGGYDKESAEKDLEDGLGHLVAFGRPFIANPDLVDRMQNDRDLTDPNQQYFYQGGTIGYTDYPKVGEERESVATE